MPDSKPLPDESDDAFRSSSVEALDLSVMVVLGGFAYEAAGAAPPACCPAAARSPRARGRSGPPCSVLPPEPAEHMQAASRADARRRLTACASSPPTDRGRPACGTDGRAESVAAGYLHPVDHALRSGRFRCAQRSGGSPRVPRRRGPRAARHHESPFLDTRRSVPSSSCAGSGASDVHVIAASAQQHPGTVAAAGAWPTIPASPRSWSCRITCGRAGQDRRAHGSGGRCEPVPSSLQHPRVRAGSRMPAMSSSRSRPTSGVKQSVDGVEMATLELLAAPRLRSPRRRGRVPARDASAGRRDRACCVCRAVRRQFSAGWPGRSRRSAERFSRWCRRASPARRCSRPSCAQAGSPPPTCVYRSWARRARTRVKRYAMRADASGAVAHA